MRKRGAATVGGRSGFEAIADGDSGKGKLNHLVDVVPAGDRIFMLVAAGPKGFATGDEAEKFRELFPRARRSARSVSGGCDRSGAIVVAPLGRLRLAQILDEALNVL